MNAINEKPRIIVKSKNIQIVIDFCIQQKTEFTVIPRNASNDEWEVELNIKSITKAIEWGMFIKANKLDFIVNELFNINKPIAQTPPIPKVKPKTRERKETQAPIADENKSEQNNLLSFDLNQNS